MILYDIPKCKKSWINPDELSIGRKAFRKEGSALHLVRYEGHTLLWAVGIGWNSCGLLATPINLLESRIEIKMPVYWQSCEIVAWQRQTTHCFQHKRHYNESWLECLAVPCVFTRHCSWHLIIICFGRCNTPCPIPTSNQ